MIRRPMIKLTVIIPTRNRARTLSKLLESIQKQTLDQSLFEVIVCDNSSTDKTATIARSFANKFKNFKYIKTLEVGLHVGRNRGFQEARGDILVYTDDDTEAFPEWLHTINEAFRDKNVVLVGGKSLPKWEIDPPKWAWEMWKLNKNSDRVLSAFSIIDLGDEIKEIDPYYVFGCNFSVRKKVIFETQGFHPDGMPQEMIQYRGDGENAISEYIKQKRYISLYHPKASVYHLVSKERLTIRYLWRRGFNQGVSDSYTTIRKQKSTNKFRKSNLLLKNILRYLLKSLKSKHTENGKYRRALSEGYEAGYNFHQQKVKEDARLEAWVVKENYLDTL